MLDLDVVLKLLLLRLKSLQPLAAPPPSKAGGKRPAWDVKGRMEDMEKKFEESCKRLEALEAEKQELQDDVEVKHEVVVKSSEEIRALQTKIEDSDNLLT